MTQHEVDFIVLSYPRSGNHWVRYIIEWFSGAPTLGESSPQDTPIYTRTRTPIIQNPKNPIAQKRHWLQMGDKEKQLILIVRNYKECIVRHMATANEDIQDRQKHQFHLNEYAGHITEYENWPVKKHLVYYEDLLKNPEKEIQRLLIFMKIYDKHKLHSFMQNFSSHRDNALYTLIAESITRGLKAIHHSNTVPQHLRLEWDMYLVQQLNSTYSKYLKRYKD